MGDGLYGLDIKEIDGKFYCIEVNDNPTFWGQHEDIKDMDLYDKIIERLAVWKAGKARDVQACRRRNVRQLSRSFFIFAPTSRVLSTVSFVMHRLRAMDSMDIMLGANASAYYSSLR